MSCGVTACCAAASAAASTVAPRARNCGSEKIAAGARPSTATTVRRFGSRALLSAPGGDPSSSGQRSRSAPRKRRPEGLERDQRRGAGMLQSPGEFTRRRERAERGDDGADLGGTEGGDNPFRSVGDQQSDPVSTPDADGEQCPGEFIHPRLEAGVIEALVAKHQSLSAGRSGRHLIDQIAKRAAGRARARAVTHRVLIHSEAAASRGTRRRPRRSPYKT